MKKLILCLAILSVSLCIPAMSHAAPVIDNYSGTVTNFHANFTFVDPATSKLKTVPVHAAAPQGIKNAEISRELDLNAIGPYNSPNILAQMNHGVLIMQPSMTALTSSTGVTMSNVVLVFYFWDGTVGFDPGTYTWSGTGKVYACETGGTLIFIPASSGTKAVMKITNITPAVSIFFTVTGGTVGAELPAMATGITLPAISFKKVSP